MQLMPELDRQGNSCFQVTSGEGGAMTAIAIFGAAAGVILGLCHFRVFALLPVVLIFAAGAVVGGVATGLERSSILLGLLAAVASPQIGYLASSIAVTYLIAEYLRIRATGKLPASLHAMQAEIGRELKSAFELPLELPREMAALLAQMNEREG
jgi:hypothetical protein